MIYSNLKIKITQCIFITILSLAQITCYCQADDKSDPVKVTLCELVENPNQYIGKIIQVKADIINTDLELSDPRPKIICSRYMGVVIELTDTIQPKPDFDTIEDDSFKKVFDDLSKGMKVQATIVGRFEAAYFWQNQKQTWIVDSKNKQQKGFGENGQYGGRIILYRVSYIYSVYRPSL